jgi:hypothetical protein
VELTFLTPVGAVVAAGAILTLGAFALHERRASRIRAELGLEAPTWRSRIPTLVALCLVPVLLGLALAQPVLRSSQVEHLRTDAEIFYVFDTSRSMQAGPPGAATRLDQALSAAARIHLRLSEFRSGAATMTDRVLPNLFPTPDDQVFTATLDQTVGIDRPPAKGLSSQSTTFAALDTLAGYNFFDSGLKHRLVILFTDGETAPYYPSELRAALRQPPRTSFVILRYWHANDRILQNGHVDAAYRPDPTSAQAVDRLASALDGRALGGGDVDGAVKAARQFLGTGPLESYGVGLHVVELSRWFALAALFPLAFLLWRRNFA